MEGGERKEAAALPPDYVSLAQLQERWLQKQEEAKLKQKREEEEKRERDALALKQKQEAEERERDARGQNGRRWNQNQDQRGGAKIGGGFVRATGGYQEKGKGKEIICGGPGDGGENNWNIGKKGGNGRRKKKFKGTAASEEEGSAVERVGCVSVVEVLPRNGEIDHVNGSDLRGGFKKKGRDKGSLRVNELKQSEEEGGKKCSESGKGDEKGGDGGSERGGDGVRGSEEEGERRRGSGRGGDRGRGGERWSERGVDRGRSEEEGERRRGSERGGDTGRGGERWSERGGEGGSERGGEGGRSDEEGERRRGSERGGDRGRGGEGGSERGVDRGRRGERRGERGGWRRKNGGDRERKINMLKEYRPVISEVNEVVLKLVNKADPDEISEVRSGIASLRVGDVNETRGLDNRVKENGAEGGGSKMDKVAVEIEKKDDHKDLARKGENKGSWKEYRAIGIRGHANNAKDGGVEGEGSNGEIVAVEIEKKGDHKVVSRKGGNRGHGRGYRENNAKEDVVEGGNSNGEEVAVEIEKKVHHKVLPRKGENRGYGRGYRENKAKEDIVEGGGSNGEEVAVEIEKKVDHKVLSRKGENKGRENKAKEDLVEGGDSNGEEVAVEIEKKVDHKVVPKNGENRSYGRAYREIGFCGRENKAKVDGVDGGGSNSEALAVEIEKKVDHKVLPRKDENRISWSAYPANGNRSRDFGRGRSYMRSEHDDFSVKPRKCGMAWVKKEDRLNA